jgi:hypothetical protein
VMRGKIKPEDGSMVDLIRDDRLVLVWSLWLIEIHLRARVEQEKKRMGSCNMQYRFGLKQGGCVSPVVKQRWGIARCVLVKGSVDVLVSLMIYTCVLLRCTPALW